jgi:hypothetical protein
MNDRMLIRSLKGRSFIYHKQRKLFLKKLARNISTLAVWHSLVDVIALFAGVTTSEFDWKVFSVDRKVFFVDQLF